VEYRAIVRELGLGRLPRLNVEREREEKLGREREKGREWERWEREEREGGRGGGREGGEGVFESETSIVHSTSPLSENTHTCSM
jgi:hypothetical protein